VQRNELEERCEFYLDDSERLRQKLNEPPVAAEREVWQRRRQSKMAQLEAVNAELERMVSELEEEGRRGRESLKLCARYHGKCDFFLVYFLACSLSLLPSVLTCLGSSGSSKVKIQGMWKWYDGANAN
jgi:hypothetical protein